MKTCLSRVFSYLFLISALAAFHSDGGDEEKGDTEFSFPEDLGTDVTEEFKRTRNQLRNNEEAFQNTAQTLEENYKILLVPGFLFDGMTRLGQDYYDNQMDYLQDKDIPHQRLDQKSFETEGSLEHNAKVIQRKIKNAQRPVIIFAHSKGALDVLHTLITSPQIKKQVAAFLPLQGPFYGSPIATWVYDEDATDEKLKEIIRKVFGGDSDALEEMKVQVRRNYMKKHSREVKKITRRLPVITYGSFKENTDDGDGWNNWLDPISDYILPYSRKLMKEKAGLSRSDGLVTPQATALPKTEKVIVSGVDHAMPIKDGYSYDFNQELLMKTLLKMAIKRDWRSRVPGSSWP